MYFTVKRSILIIDTTADNATISIYPALLVQKKLWPSLKRYFRYDLIQNLLLQVLKLLPSKEQNFYVNSS